MLAANEIRTASFYGNNEECGRPPHPAPWLKIVGAVPLGVKAPSTGIRRHADPGAALPPSGRRQSLPAIGAGSALINPGARHSLIC